MSRSSTTPTVSTHLPVTQVRQNLGAVLQRVRQGKERIILEKCGLPVAALLDIEEYEDLMETRDEGARQDIAIGNREIAAGKAVSARALADELDEIARRVRTATPDSQAHRREPRGRSISPSPATLQVPL